MFNIIHLQLAVAQEKLPKEHLQDVVNACIQVLREVQRDMYDGILKGWKDMPPENLAASVNDNKRLNDKCDEFAEGIPGKRFAIRTPIPTTLIPPTPLSSLPSSRPSSCRPRA
jgi:hypothetical protein